ncbi:ATP-binding protein [Paramaledivibacter caminithermalis]|jgi:serine/threonine-protein kinase RsbW|uniref:Serine/threonine-protein kinase RsbW n=1 Tax=Paramaledivibacter caminithermalis (strain DSM 15212 / CIP 107654 / DViRD3) TaxID=1121301 RepID=A0A1M6NXD6_PARC5|nr:ATP-binding protein [Paramaledivibacter caminithermalis]SHK00395.1 serine/threonine-protein kinase RsbW [Paramaledivibacter caminithermalis DSM 15212]
MTTKCANKSEDSKKENICMSLPSKPEYVSIVRMTSSVIANKIGFNIEDIEDIKVAVGEACNNAVLHGCDSNIFKVEFIISEEKFIIEIEDEGKGFNVDKYPHPDICNPKESGLGIFIIKSLMDNVEVKSSPGKGTFIRMIKFLNEKDKAYN